MAKKLCSLVVLIALLFVGLSLASTVIPSASRTARADPGVLYAAPTAQGSGNCSSWADACTLQTALAQAVSSDEIWVQAGVHYPGTAGNRTATFALENGVALYGGFAGTETLRTQRDWQANKTILSGDIDQNDVNTDGNFIAETWNNIQGDNAYHVVTASATNNTAVLDGFVITAGQANGTDSASRGGGMYNDAGSPTLTNVTFSGNLASRGSGMYNYSGSPTLTNVTFSGNWATHYGGGMWNYDSSPTLTNVTFSGNSANYGGGMGNYVSTPTLTNVTFSGNDASYRGGGMYNYTSSPSLTNVTFSGNSATYDGGGMWNYDNSSPSLVNVTFSGNSADYGGGMGNYYNNSPTLTNVTFSDNSATYDGGGMGNYDNSSPSLTNVTFSGNSANYGGGMSNDDSSPTLTNVTFSGNSATYYGGGMGNYDSSPTLTNVTFSGNSATYDGGGMWNYDNSSPTLTNVTFSGNSANYGGGIWNGYSSPTLVNCILWGNSASSSGPQIHDGLSSSTTVTYSIVQGGWSGMGNLDANPLFVDPANGNLRLGPGSPAIDSGNNAVCPATDLDGLPRPNDGDGDGTATCDMGAYEAGTMLCEVIQGNTYEFPNHSGVSIKIDILGSELACLYVDEMGLDHPNATSPLQTGRYWLIRGLRADRQTSAGGFEATLTLPANFTPGDNDKVCRYTGSGQVWDCAMSVYTGDSITRDRITAFSDWVVGRNAGPTAIRLTDMTAHTSGNPYLALGAMGMTLFAALGLRRVRHKRATLG